MFMKKPEGVKEDKNTRIHLFTSSIRVLFFKKLIAESEGFEPPVPAIGTTDFESVPFDHSGSFPFRSNEKKKGTPFFTLKRRMRDSNPRRYDPQRFSRPPQ
jgi:hypothetical protein